MDNFNKIELDKKNHDNRNVVLITKTEILLKKATYILRNHGYVTGQ